MATFNGKTFDLRNVGPTDDARLYERLFTDGILRGCAITYSGVDLTIARGTYIMAGRAVTLDNAETFTTSPTYSNGYGRLKYVIDLSAAASESSFTQGSTVWQYASTNLFASLTQEDINDGTHTTYEVELCRVQYSSGTIASVVSEMDECAINGVWKSPLRFSSQTVLTGAWSSSDTYADYPYRAAVPLTGVTADMYAHVVFAPVVDAISLIAPVCRTYDGGVYVYAVQAPTASVSIESIKVEVE